MIRVIDPGLMTTVQDDGRMDYLAFGLPRAGVMDRYAARIANLLCGNPLGAAVLEMTLQGGIYQFMKACRIGVCGAEMGMKLNGASVPTWAALEVSSGDTLELGYASAGCRAYLAVGGGIDVPVVMGSRSTYTRARLGGHEGRRLQAGDEIATGESPPLAAGPVVLEKKFIPDYGQEIVLRVLLGPQEDLFTQEGIDMFLQGQYEVTDESDRMGCRLEGPSVRHRDKADIVSDALCFGAVQVPGNGQPIIMMADCGTTGGYAKIATVIGADLGRLAQAQTQTRVSFRLSTEAEAVACLTSEAEQYRRVAALVTTGPKSITGGALPQRMEMRINGVAYQVEIAEVKE